MIPFGKTVVFQCIKNVLLGKYFKCYTRKKGRYMKLVTIVRFSFIITLVMSLKIPLFSAPSSSDTVAGNVDIKAQKDRALSAKQDVVRVRADLATASDKIKQATKQYKDADDARKSVEKTLQERRKAVQDATNASKKVIENARKLSNASKKEAQSLRGLKQQKIKPTDVKEVDRVADDVEATAKSVDEMADLAQIEADRDQTK